MYHSNTSLACGVTLLTPSASRWLSMTLESNNLTNQMLGTFSQL